MNKRRLMMMPLGKRRQIDKLKYFNRGCLWCRPEKKSIDKNWLREKTKKSNI